MRDGPVTPVEYEGVAPCEKVAPEVAVCEEEAPRRQRPSDWHSWRPGKV